MNVSQLQAELRRFAAERDWQPVHTPKNLSTALMVEAATLAGVFQWLSPEESQAEALTPEAKQRVSGAVASVLAHLLQIADHCQIDIARAMSDKMTADALKHPPLRTIPRATPTRAGLPGTHVLLDFENVQPTESELRALVPEATQVWVFHGPQQHQPERRFNGYGHDVTAVPISKAGKNALDFHLAFYVGYIASRSPSASLVVVANDKGYAPMVEHARGLGFAARQVGHGKVAGAVQAGLPAARKAVTKKAAAKKVPGKKPVAKKTLAKKAVAKKSAAKVAAATKAVVKRPAAKKIAAKSTGPTKAAAKKLPAGIASGQADLQGVVNAGSQPAPKGSAASAAPDAGGTVSRLVDSLRKMADKRPAKLKSLERMLASLLGADSSDGAVEAALARLAADGVVSVDAEQRVAYPAFVPR